MRWRRFSQWIIAAVSLAFTLAVVDAGTGQAAAQDDTFSRIDRWVLEENYVDAFHAAAAVFDSLQRRHGPLHDSTLDALHELATIAHLSGDQHTAEHLSQVGLDLRRKLHGEDDPSLARGWYLRGVIARYAQDLDLSWRCYERAEALLAPPRAGQESLRGDLLQKQGSWLRVRSMHEAISHYQQALAYRRAATPDDTFAIADNLVWLAWHLYRVRWVDEAEAAAAEAESLLIGLGLPDHGLMGTLRQLQGEELARAARWAQAETAFADACRAYENSRQGHFPGLSRRKSRLEGYRWLALCQLMQGKNELAWESLQHSLLNLSIDFGYLQRWQTLEPATYPRYAQAKREAGRWMSLVNGTGSRGNGEHALQNWGVVCAEIQATAELYRLEQGYLRRQIPDRIAREDIQPAMRPDQACVGWLEWLPRVDIKEDEGGALAACWGYVLRDTGPVQWVPLWTSRDPKELRRVTRSRTLSRDICLRASGWRLRMQDDPELYELSRDTAGTFFEPLRPYLDGVEELMVELSWQHPFTTPLESQVGTGGKYLLEEYDISYVFSAFTHWSLSQSPPRPLTSALVLADPRYNLLENDAVGPDVANLSHIPSPLLRKALDRDPEALDSLPRLYFSMRESEAIERLFPEVTSLTGELATESALNRLAESGRLSTADIIHLAAHALLGNIPERSALALSRIGLDSRPDDDGLIEAREVYLRWDLHTELLTLSGCQTAGTEWGFHQVLHAAGARCILASMWKVDDAATALLMERFYENLQDPRRKTSKARALREAKAWLREYEIEGHRPFAHPAYWAPFILIGDAD